MADELFANVEINRTPRAPRLLRALAGSVAFHLLLLAAIIYVPTVSAMFHLVSIFSQVDYVNEDYARTSIHERVVMLSPDDLSGKFHYPVGYFSKIAAHASDAQVIAEAKPSPTPKPTPLKIKATPTPTPTPEVEASPIVAQNDPQTNAMPTASPSPEAAPKAAEEIDKVAAQAGVKRFPRINAKPFKDLLAKGRELKNNGGIDLNGTIELIIEADRNPDGTLSNIEITSGATSDQKLKELAKEFIQALSASRALAVLEDARHLRMMLRSDQKSINARVTTETDSASRADTLANVYSIMLIGARFDKRNSDEAEIWKNVSVAADGKQIVVKFDMSRAAAGAMIAKHVPAS